MRAHHLIAFAGSLALATGCSRGDSPSPAVKEPTGAATSGAATGAPATPGVVGEMARAEIGKPAPDFKLPKLGGGEVSLSAHKGKVVVLEWFNPDCPYVKNSHTNGQLKGLASKYEGEVVWLAVNSNAEGKQGSSQDANEAGRERYGIGYPILFDATGKVGTAYGATHTPHMYVIDAEGVLVYAGAIDNTRGGDPEDTPEVVNYVANALEDVKAGKAVREPKTQAFGCTVKYAKQ